jgi:hypothetical protein
LDEDVRPMGSELDDAGDGAIASSSEARGVSDLLPQEERDTLSRGELVFPKEADTLTMHASGTLMDEQDGSTARLLREADPRDPAQGLPPPPAPRFGVPRMPVPPVPPPPRAAALRTPVPPSLSRAVPPPLPKKPASIAPPVDDEDILAEDELFDDTTEASTRVVASDDPTSPTLSLANRSDSSREVYRLFLASEYAPALELANELIARGDDDPILITIARECRLSLAGERRGSSAPPSLIRDDQPGALAGLKGDTTLDEVAAMLGVSLEHVLHILERFGSMSALGPRPPTS